METKNRNTLVIGAILLGIGLLLFLGQVVGLQNLGITWPFIIVGLGALFFVGMLLGGKSVSGLAIPGSIIAGIGLMVWVQDTFAIWETWSYAWALIICFVGLGILIHGLWGGSAEARSSGWGVIKVGLILFLVFGAIFEFIFSFTGISSMQSGIFFPVALMGLGAILLVVRIVRLFGAEEEGKKKERDLFWPVLFIGLGALWLMVRLGMIPGEQVSLALGLWPLLLVAAGIELVIGRRLPLVNMLLGVLVVAAMFFAVYFGEQFGLKRTSWFIPDITFSEDGFNMKRINGTGNVVSESRPVSGFTKINLGAIGDAEIIQGTSTDLEIQAEDNLMPYLTSEVRGDTLYLGVKPGTSFGQIEKIHYTIHVTDLNAVKVSGVGNVSMDSLKTDQFSLSLSGMGKFKVADIQADEMKADFSGSGSAEVGGKVSGLDVGISGSGNLDGANLQTQTAKVRISGVGKLTLWVVENLDVSISGAGSVSYYGGPAVKQQISGAGSVKALGAK